MKKLEHTEAEEFKTQSEWHQRWKEGRTGWDQGTYHSALPELVKTALDMKILQHGDHLIEPGCGRAHGGAFLAQQGFTVTSFDLSDHAVNQAIELYGKIPHLNLVVKDALQEQPLWLNRYHAVFDRAMLCALAPSLRKAYLDFCYQVLKKNGLILSILFSKVDLLPSEGPPFEIDSMGLGKLIGGRFEILFQKVLPQVSSGKVQEENMVILRKIQR